MKKALLSLAAIALAVSSASAADLLYQLDFGKNVNVDNKFYPNNSVYTGNFTYTLTADETFDVACFNNNNNGWADMIKCGRKSNASVGMITSNFRFPDKLTQVVLGISKFNEAGKVNSFKVQSSADNTTWTDVATAAESDYDGTTKTLTLNVANTTADLYYRVAIDCASAKGNGVVWLTSVKYYGEAEIGGKEPAGLSYAQSTYTAPLSDGFYYVELNNPHGIFPVTYTSSNPEVAVMGDWGLELKGVGTTVITASTAETDTYKAGTASFILNVVESVNTVADLLEKAGQKGDRIFFSGELNVAYANGNYLYVTDNYDTPALLYKSGANFNSVYKAGDVISGLELECTIYNGLTEYTPLTLPEASFNFGVVYPTLEAITDADINKVGYISLTFDAATIADTSATFIGKTAAGADVTCYNQFKVASVEAGTYNVLCAVNYNSGKGGLQIFPIAYEKPIELAYPDHYDVTVDSEYVTVTQGEEQGSLAINISGITPNPTVKVNIATPEGWDGLLLMTQDTDVVISPVQPQSKVAKAPSADWMSVSDLTAYGARKANSFSFSADNFGYELNIIPFSGDKAAFGYMTAVSMKVKHDPNTGVDEIASEEEVSYYTLQGVKVENPENGVYVKVANGKATKVVIK